MAWIAAAGAIGGALISDSSQKKAAKSLSSANRHGAEIQKRLTEQSRFQSMQLAEAAQKNALAGYQGGMDVLGQTIPAQLQALQGGNMNAQNTTRAGLDPQIAAILGGNIDLSGLQPQQAPMPDFGMFQQQLPDFQTVSGALNLQPDFSNVLSGSGNPLENMTPEGFQQRVQNANAQNGLNYQPTDFFPGINERMQNAQQPQTGMNDPNNAFLLGGNF